jgi:hypothetical protein
VDVGVARLKPEQSTLLTVVGSEEVIYPVYTLVLSVLEGRTEELGTDGEVAEVPEELVLVAAEEEARVVEETLDNVVLETEDELRVENMLDDVPTALDDEAEDDAEELELLVEDPDGVALTEPLGEESDEDDDTEEMLDDDITGLLEVPGVAELLLELRSLLLELTVLLELLGLAEMLDELRDEKIELDEDVIELLLVKVGSKLEVEFAPELDREEDVLKDDALEIPKEDEEVCNPVERVVSDEDDVETVEDMDDDMEEGIDEELVAADVLGAVEELEIVPDVIEYVEDDDIMEVDVDDMIEVKLETLVLAELETLLVEELAVLLETELEELLVTSLDELLVTKLETELEELEKKLETLKDELETELVILGDVLNVELEAVIESGLDRLVVVLAIEL